jgi:hypothetical protein
MKNFFKQISFIFFIFGTLALSGCSQQKSLLDNTIKEKSINIESELKMTGTTNNSIQKTTPTADSKNENIVEQKVIPEKKAICKKLRQFKNEIWAEDLNSLYKKQFLETQEIFNGSVWPDVSREGQDSCIIGNYLIFIPEFSEFGCMRIFKYDIEKNILDNTIFGGELCANRFGEITDSYIEYFGIMGDGLYKTEYRGKYYYMTNTQELTEKKNVKME